MLDVEQMHDFYLLLRMTRAKSESASKNAHNSCYVVPIVYRLQIQYLSHSYSANQSRLRRYIVWVSHLFIYLFVGLFTKALLI